MLIASDREWNKLPVNTELGLNTLSCEICLISRISDEHLRLGVTHPKLPPINFIRSWRISVGFVSLASANFKEEF